MTHSDDEKKGIVADENGAMMVMGLFMSLFLIGGLYYILGVGEAVIFRRLMQDGVDAGAFAASVTAAKGMNLIVLLNIFMMVVVAILMLIRLALYIVTGLLALSWLAPPLIPPLTAARNWLKGISEAYEQGVAEPGTKLLNGAIGRVKVLTPLMAESRSLYEASSTDSFDPPVITGFVLPLRGPKLIDGSHGLPVEEDEVDVLCERPMLYVTDLIGEKLGFLESIAGSLVKKGLGLVGGLIGRLLGACDDDLKPPYKVVDKRSEDGVVWLGHEEFQYRAFALGADPHKDRWQVGEAGVRMAQGAHEDGQNAAHAAHIVGRASVAQSEYFYGRGEKKSKWERRHPKEDWMWYMEWRARLRRFRVPSHYASTEERNSSCIAGKVGPVPCRIARDFIRHIVFVH